MKKVSILLPGLVLSILTFASGTNNGFNEAFGPLFQPAPYVPPLVGPRHGLDSLHRWNQIAINASGLDHTPVAPGENRVFGEQLGPGHSRSTRRSARPPTIRWLRCFHRKRRLLMAISRKIWLSSGTRCKRQTESIWGSGRLQPFWPCVSMMVRNSPSRALAWIIFRAINPGTGDKIQSA